MDKVEAFIAVEMNPSTLFAEESVRENLSYRSIVAWRGGKLQISDKNLVKKYWHGPVGHDLAHGDKQKKIEAQIAEKEKNLVKKFWHGPFVQKHCGLAWGKTSDL